LAGAAGFLGLLELPAPDTPSVPVKVASRAAQLGGTVTPAITRDKKRFPSSESSGTATYACTDKLAAATQSRPAVIRYTKRANGPNGLSLPPALLRASGAMVAEASISDPLPPSDSKLPLETNCGTKVGVRMPDPVNPPFSQ
jgi:hypothetical protein